MSLCQACSGVVPASAQACPRCGTPTPWAATMILDAAETIEGDPPGAAGTPARPPSSTPAWVSPSAAIDHGRFAPGDLVADRYRIIGRLGRGGMGEVFRADDLRLGQPVALKFLPGTLERDPMKLAQFHAEVRFARQVSHPNVCRVYDIGEADGVPFISMEYVDGEDLASLVRRIGRLPQDKGLDIARQLCAGLAAAHERGVLHRDLKPANVMLDSVGKIRLTDFGLAAVVGTVDAARAGTPAFMSPEQLAGREVDARSDIYSLGVVLYEVFTGHRAFDAASIGELMRRHEGVLVTRPTELVPELDPLIEQGVLRCLAYDPANRPATALAVAASLPGGDPLAAALAAGETPSPEMVAAAGETTAMPRRTALLCVAGLAGLVAATFLESAAGGVLMRLPSPKPPAVLLDRAQALVGATGYTAMAMSASSGFEPNTGRRGFSRKKDELVARRVAGSNRPDSFAFFYRTSPRHLRPLDPSGNVTSADPPLATPGMTLVRLDPEGRLLSFAAVPSQVAPAATAPFDWSVFLRAAEIDAKMLTATDPTWTPPAYADTRVAWTGEWPDRPGTPLRVEAASFKGRPVSFQLIGPWTRPSEDHAPETSAHRSFVGAFVALAIVAVIAAAALVSRTNLRAGRGDRAGALRIAWALGLSQMIAWLLSATHVADPGAEFVRFLAALGQALVIATFAWMLYVALEPWVRRFWPDSLKGWTRLLSGGVSDPRVGRDVMIGLAFGLGLELMIRLSIPLHDLLGLTGPPPMLGRIELLAGPMYALGQLAALVSTATFNALTIVFLIVGLKVGLRRMPLVVLATIAFYVIISVPSQMAEGGTPWIGASLGVLAIVATVTVTVRYGLLATNMAFLASYVTSVVPVSLSFGEWQAQPTIMAGLILLALVAWGGWTAAGGRHTAALATPNVKR